MSIDNVAYVEFQQSNTGFHELNPVVVFQDGHTWTGDAVIKPGGHHVVRLNADKEGEGPNIHEDGTKLHVGFHNKNDKPSEKVWNSKTELTYHSEGGRAIFQYILTLGGGAECQFEKVIPVKH